MRSYVGTRARAGHRLQIGDSGVTSKYTADMNGKYIVEILVDCVGYCSEFIYISWVLFHF